MRPEENEFERSLRNFGQLILRVVFCLVLFIVVVSIAFWHDVLESALVRGCASRRSDAGVSFHKGEMSFDRPVHPEGTSSGRRPLPGNLNIKFFHASERLVHTGWFVELLATQTLVLLVTRTMGNPLRASPARRWRQPFLPWWHSVLLYH